MVFAFDLIAVGQTDIFILVTLNLFVKLFLLIQAMLEKPA